MKWHGQIPPVAVVVLGPELEQQPPALVPEASLLGHWQLPELAAVLPGGWRWHWLEVFPCPLDLGPCLRLRLVLRVFWPEVVEWLTMELPFLAAYEGVEDWLPAAAVFVPGLVLGSEEKVVGDPVVVEAPAELELAGAVVAAAGVLVVGPAAVVASIVPEPLPRPGPVGLELVPRLLLRLVLLAPR